MMTPMNESSFFLRFLPRGESRHETVRRYAAAVLISLAFIALRWLLGHVLDDGQPYIILFIPVTLSAFFGGFGPGLVSVLTTIACADYFLIPPLYTIGLPDNRVIMATLLFSAAGLVVSALGEVGRSAVLQVSGEAEVSKLAHEQLLANEERLQITEQVISGGVWDWDIVADTVYWSDGYRRMMDYPLGDPSSREKWVACLHPDDREHILRQLDAFLEQKLHNWSLEYRTRTATGRIRWIASYGQSFYDSWGNPTRMVGINLDISARRFAEVDAHESEPRARTG